MKFALALFKYFAHGGLQLDTMRIVSEAVKRGHQVTLFTGEIRSELPDLPGFECVEIPLKSKSNHRKALEFEKKFHALADGRFDAALAMNRIRGCDFYFAADDCMADEFKRRHHPLIVKLLPRYRVFSELESGIFSPPSKTVILYLAAKQKSAFIRNYATEKERFILLPPGIPERYRNSADRKTARQNLAAEFGISAEETVFVTIAANFRLKGIDRTLNLLSRLPDEEKKSLRYIVIGPDKPEPMQALAKKLGLADKVIFTGGRTDAEKLLAGADMMLHLPYSEATGTVIAEALCTALPVLSTENCGFAAFAAEAGNLTVPEEYDEDLALEKLKTMLENLMEQRQRSENYARENDFFRRSADLVDILEKFSR